MNVNEYKPIIQIIDERNKCRYIITNNKTIIPVYPSGSIYNLNISYDIKKYLNKFKTNFNKLYNLFKKYKGDIDIKPSGYYYNYKNKDVYTITAIYIKKNISVPIIPEKINSNEIKKFLKKFGIKSFTSINKAKEDNIDNEILKGDTNIFIDDRLSNIKKNNYEEESYELFRLEFSKYLKNNKNIKKEIIGIRNNNEININEKENLLKKRIYKFIDNNLYKIYSNLKGGSKSDKKFIIIDNKKKDLINYRKRNIRTTCNSNKTKNKCNKNIHCKWINKNCNLSLNKELLIKFINVIVEELINNSLKSKELLEIDNYYVSDIVNNDIFEERKYQKIIKHDGKIFKKY